jgi:hypothetical protein
MKPTPLTDDDFQTMSELLGYPNPEGLHPVETRWRDFARRLKSDNDLKHQHEAAALDSDSIVASCNCGAKPPVIRYHKVGCKYRLIEERDALKRLLREARDALVQASLLSTGQDCPAENHNVVVSAIEALQAIDATLDPDCLEGPPRTREERAADARALEEVAPTPAEKIALMFGKIKETTDELSRRYHENEKDRHREEYLRLAQEKNQGP